MFYCVAFLTELILSNLTESAEAEDILKSKSSFTLIATAILLFATNVL